MQQIIRLFLVILFLNLTACQIFVPLIEGFKDTGMTESDRAQLLQKELKQFHFALTDSDRSRAMAFATGDFLLDFKNIVRQMSRNERQVSAQVDFVEMQESAFKAEVEVFFKYFRQTDYIVKERLVKESWEYSRGSGWKLSGFKVMEELT